MKAIRRSIKGEKHESRPHHISITPKSAIAIMPPKKVIKALHNYTPDPNRPQELGFTKGDFFHVISRENDEEWYEACNPLIPTARGLVPVSFFEVIAKNERASTGSSASVASNQPPDSAYASGGHGRTDSSATAKTPNPMRMSAMGKGAMVYGIVLYDFNAERPDELEAKAGEAIIVIAQSNPEWFVAKPIGRLGGPGLIPVSFIEIRDMTTGQAVPDPMRAVQQAGVPKVEEWKKLAADYKNSSITLGKFETSNPQQQQQQQQQQTNSMARDMANMSLGNGQQQSTNGNHNPAQPYPEKLLAPISASIPRYCFENDKYWYIIECVLEDGSHWELSRFYQNFYDFQINLLQAFPEEAAPSNGSPRILPFMPGPVTYVTDAISNGRRESLDLYVKALLQLPHYISRCDLVKRLFQPVEGDFELDPKAMAEDYRLSNLSQQSGSNSQSLSQQSSHDQMGHNGNSFAQQQQRPNHQRNQSSQQYSNGGNSMYGAPPQGVQRQQSNLTQMSTNSSSTPPLQGPGGAANPSGALKIKVFFEDDLIAIRVPDNITFLALKDKLKERLKVREEIMIQYKDEPSGGYAELLNDRDLDLALQRNAKLTLYVGYA